MNKNNFLTLSDLHLEFSENLKIFDNSMLPRIKRWLSSSKNNRGVFLNGDIAIWGGGANEKRQREALTSLFYICAEHGAMVFYIAGNHEFYGQKYTRHQVLDSIRSFCNKFRNVFFLEKDEAIFQIEERKYRVAGCTLFSNGNGSRNYGDKETLAEELEILNDFNAIRDFTPEQFLQEGEESKSFLSKISPRKQDETLIIMSHHIPSRCGISMRFSSFPNTGFLCDCEDIALAKKPDFWLFGHTHDASSFKIGGTQFIAEPFGYPSHNDSRYWGRVFSC